MAWRLDINGVDVSEHVSECRFRLEANELPRGDIVADGIWPEEDDEVVVYATDGATPIFGGLVLNTRVYGETIDINRVKIDVSGWERYFGWCSLSLSYGSAVALEDVLDDMMATLSAYGFSYTPSATGVTLAPFSVEDMPGAELLRQLRQRTGRVIRILPDKEIVVETWGQNASPFVINDAAMARLNKFEVDNQPRERANTVKGRFGPTGQFLTTQRWVADGTATAWVTDIPAAGPAPAVVQVDDGVTPILATVGSGGMYEWDVTTNAPYGTLSVGTAGTPANGVTLVIGPSMAAGDAFTTDGFLGVYPFPIQKTTGGSPPREYRVTRPDVTDFGAADEYMTQLLASLDRATARVLDVETDEDGFDAGQAMTVSTSERGGVSGSFLVGAVDVRLVLEDYWRYSFKATEGLEPQASYQERTRQALGGTSNTGGAIAAIPPGGGGTVTAVPWAYLGGARNTAETIASAGTYEPVPQAVEYVAPATYSGRVRAQIRAGSAGHTVTARLRNVTDSATAGTSSGVLGVTMTEVTFVVSIVAGKRYRLELSADTSGARAYGIGSVEAA